MQLQQLSNRIWPKGTTPFYSTPKIVPVVVIIVCRRNGLNVPIGNNTRNWLTETCFYERLMPWSHTSRGPYGIPISANVGDVAAWGRYRETAEANSWRRRDIVKCPDGNHIDIARSLSQRWSQFYREIGWHWLASVRKTVGSLKNAPQWCANCRSEGRLLDAVASPGDCRTMSCKWIYLWGLGIYISCEYFGQDIGCKCDPHYGNKGFAFS